MMLSLRWMKCARWACLNVVAGLVIHVSVFTLIIMFIVLFTLSQVSGASDKMADSPSLTLVKPDAQEGCEFDVNTRPGK